MISSGFCITLVSIVLIAGCANPVNQVTSDNYAETCSVAESNQNLSVAEEACYRSLVNVDLGNLGPELKSQRLYNLGRIKRQLAKFSEAESLLRLSLEIESQLSAQTDPKIGRRLVELAVSLAGQDRWMEGAALLEQALPIALKFSDSEKAYLVLVLSEFSMRIAPTNPELAKTFETKSKEII